MRKGLAMSIALHGGILAWALGVFPGPEQLRPREVKAVPIDVVTTAELTKIKAGLKDRKNAKPTPVAKKKPKPQPKKKKAKVKPRKSKAARQQAAPKPKAPAPRKKVAKKTKPKAKAVKKQVDKAALNNLVSKALERKTKTPPRKRAPTAKKNFNADKIAALLNKVPDAGDPTPASETPAKKTVPQAKGRPTGFDEKLTLSEIDALRARISQCWTPPTGATGADALKVKLRLTLNRDGTLTRQPQIMNSGNSPFFQVAADSAVRAVWQCQPYQLPARKFALWRDMVLNFDPREMFGG